MQVRTKRALLFTSLALAIGLAIHIATYEGEFMVEFGGAEAREEFIALLTQHEVSYTLETDHLGRTWVVPDQTKRIEYETVMNIYHDIQKERTRKLNEESRGYNKALKPTHFRSTYFVQNRTKSAPLQRSV